MGSLCLVHQYWALDLIRYEGLTGIIMWCMYLLECFSLPRNMENCQQTVDMENMIFWKFLSQLFLKQCPMSAFFLCYFFIKKSIVLIEDWILSFFWKLFLARKWNQKLQPKQWRWWTLNLTLQHIRTELDPKQKVSFTLLSKFFIL